MSPTSGADRRAQDLQALHRRGLPALGVGRTPTRSPTPRAGSWPTPRWPPARTPATPSSPPARPSPAGPAGRRTTAARSSTGSPRCWRAGAPQFVDGRPARRGAHRRPSADAAVDAAIDRLVWYAGWADKIAQVVGGANPVAGPYFNLSTPEPTGVVAVLAPQDSSLLGLVVGGRAGHRHRQHRAWWSSSERRPLPAITLAEVLATSDVPGGVVNILTGSYAETAPVAGLAHGRQRASTSPVWPATPRLATDLEVAAAENLKRVRARARRPSPTGTPIPGLDRMTAFLETKTVWHPIGRLTAPAPTTPLHPPRAECHLCALA